MTIQFQIAAYMASTLLYGRQSSGRNRRRRGNYTNRQVVHPGGRSGARAIANGILNGSDTQFKDLFRFSKPVFHLLVDWLCANSCLAPSRCQTPQQKVMVVLFILGHGATQRAAAHLFQITQSSVSAIFKTVLPMLVSLHTAFVRLPPDDWLDPTVECDPKLSAFNGCIGAIDGTHIGAHVPFRTQLPWRNRKGVVTQNVFAAVRQDYSFLYVMAGAEGSINDASLCTQAFARSFRIPEGRYYVADAGFGYRNDMVLPFPNVRYHLQDWRNADVPPENKKELYNLRHSRLRVVVEQAFGILKRRFKIVRNVGAEYDIDAQVEIVYAVTGLHNFRLAEGKRDSFQYPDGVDLSACAQRTGRVVMGRTSRQIRFTAAEALWEDYQQYLSRSD
jgi:hypothetical protein